jgi:hypothetical protein
MIAFMSAVSLSAAPTHRCVREAKGLRLYRPLDKNAPARPCRAVLRLVIRLVSNGLPVHSLVPGFDRRTQSVMASSPISTPYNFEASLSDQDFQKIGQLSLKWSHLEHLIGNCLKVLLRLSNDEARVIVFPMSLEQRITRISELAEINPLSERSRRHFDELRTLLRGIQYVRNNVVHAIVESGEDDHNFYLRSKNRTLTKTQIFSVEDITNYAAHVVFALRFSLGFADGSSLDYTLPDRPEIPEFLRSLIQFPRAQ